MLLNLFEYDISIFLNVQTKFDSNNQFWISNYIEIDQVFLTNQEGHVLPSKFTVYEALVPFEYSMLKNQLPRLILILTGNKKENELASDNKSVYLKNKFKIG